VWVVAALGNTAMLALLLANGANVNAADKVIQILSSNTFKQKKSCHVLMVNLVQLIFTKIHSIIKEYLIVRKVQQFKLFKYL
jgi:hypothetical protein